MIKEHICVGSLLTTLSTFIFSSIGMSISISSGEYIVNNEVIFSDDTGCTFDIPVSDKDIEYTIFLTNDGIVVREYVLNSGDFISIENIIDKLAWFVVPANTSDLSDVEINIRKIIDGDSL